MILCRDQTNYKMNKVFTYFTNIQPHIYSNGLSNPIVCQENTACTYISIMAFRTRYNGIYRTLHRRKSHGNINKSCWQKQQRCNKLISLFSLTFIISYNSHKEFASKTLSFSLQY